MGFHSTLVVHHGPVNQRQKALIQVNEDFISTFSKAHFIGNEKSESTREEWQYSIVVSGSGV